MKAIEYLKKNKETIQTFLLGLVAAGLFFKVNYGNIAIIAAVSYNLIFFKLENLKKLKNFGLLYPVLFFLIAILSSLYSKDTALGLDHMDLVLLMLLTTIIIINSKISDEIIKEVLKYFYWSGVVCTIVLILLDVYKLIEGQGISELVFHGFVMPYDQHPVYYSMFLSFALFGQWFYRPIQKRPIKLLLADGILVTGIVLCASKAVIAFCLIAFVITNLKSTRHAAIGIIASIFLGFAAYQIPFIKERFDDGLRFNPSISSFRPTGEILNKQAFTYEEKENISDLELRYIFGSIGIYHLIDDNKIWFGYGQGDDQKFLDFYFHTYNLAPNWFEGRNLHNQYIQWLVTYGIIVLLIFLYYLFISLRAAWIGQNKWHLFFILISCFVFVFEVTLVRNKGIVFFYFFNSLFISNYINQNFENSNTRN